jgi:hypothetical protein
MTRRDRKNTVCEIFRVSDERKPLNPENVFNLAMPGSGWFQGDEMDRLIYF